MDKKIKDYLDFNSIHMTISIVDNDIVILKYCEDIIAVFEIDFDKYKIKINNTYSEYELLLNDYAIATFVYFKCVKSCKLCHFPIEYIDFFCDSAKISKEEFLSKLRVNVNFHKIIEKSYNDILPFHFTNMNEAFKYGFERGYLLIQDYLVGVE